MDAKKAASGSPSHIEFEPLSQWQREEGKDILVLHLPEFKKEHLRVQINSRGILKISGERPINALKRTKFYKEVEVPKNCNADGIQAKFANGCLYIIIPKITSVDLSEQITKPQESVDASGADNKPKPEAPKDDQVVKPAENEQTAGSSKEKLPSSPPAEEKDGKKVAKEVSKPAENEQTAGRSKDKLTPSPPAVAAEDRKKVAKEVSKPERSVPRMKRSANTTLNVALVVASLVALVAYVFYMYRATVLEE